MSYSFSRQPPSAIATNARQHNGFIVNLSGSGSSAKSSLHRDQPFGRCPTRRGRRDPSGDAYDPAAAEIIPAAYPIGAGDFVRARTARIDLLRPFRANVDF